MVRFGLFGLCPYAVEENNSHRFLRLSGQEGLLSSQTDGAHPIPHVGSVNAKVGCLDRSDPGCRGLWWINSRDREPRSAYRHHLARSGDRL